MKSFKIVSGIFFSLLAISGFAQSDHQSSGILPIVQGSVNRIVSGDHYTVLQGDLQKIGSYWGTGGAFDPVTGSPDTEFPLFHSTVSAAISDGNGGWFVASVANNIFYIQGLVHIKSDKTIDEEWGPAIDYGITTLALDGNTLYVGGSFTSTVAEGFEFRNGLAAFDAATGDILPWDPDVTGTVNTIEVDNGIVYLGGQFTKVGGTVRKNIAAVDGVTGTVTTWNPEVDGTNSFVSDIVVAGNIVYAAGKFTSAGGSSRQSIAAIDASTGVATTWNPSPDANSRINALLLSGTILYTGGEFVSIGGQPIKHLAAVDINTGLATTWNPEFDTPGVTDLELSGTTLFAAGNFDSVNGTTRNGLASVNATTGVLTTWNPDPKTSIKCIALSETFLFAGSDNNLMYDWVERNRFAVIENETGEVTSVTIDITDEVASMIIAYDVLYLSGSFAQVNGQTRNKLAAIDLNTGELLSWSPATNGDVLSMAIKGTSVYLGGEFSSVNNTDRNGLAAVHLTSGNLLPWNADPDDGYISALHIYNDRIYIGGTFTSVKGQTRHKIAALELATGNVLSWDPGDMELEDVFLIRANADRVVIRDYEAGVNVFETDLGELTLYRLQSDDVINDLAVAQNLLIVGGTFNFLLENSYVGLGSINLDNSTNTGWYPDVWRDRNGDPAVRAVAISGNKILVGGSFETMGFEKRKGFGAFDLSLTNCSALDPIVADETTLTAPEGDFYQWFRNGDAVDGANAQTFDLDLEASAMYKVVVEVNDCPNTWLSYENIVTAVESTERSFIRAYPNPVRGKIKIESTNQEIQSVTIRNSMGVPVLAGRVDDDNMIDMTGLPAGYFILTIKTGKGNSSVRISKIE